MVNAGRPLVERYLELADRQESLDGDLVRLFVLLEWSHKEFSGRDNDHFRTIRRAFLEAITWFEGLLGVGVENIGPNLLEHLGPNVREPAPAFLQVSLVQPADETRKNGKGQHAANTLPCHFLFCAGISIHRTKANAA